MEKIILEHEERLRKAQLVSDIAALDELIADELQFVFYDGGVYTKQMDLDSHKDGVFKFKSIEFSEQRVNVFGDVAVVTTNAKLIGTSAAGEFESEMRYLRTWMKRDGRWQIIAGCVSQIF